jgi:hypothetical protein
MSRRKRGFSANLSFFAFQDIITSVTGILILVVMLMVLQLKQPGLLPAADLIPDVSIEELEKRIAEGLDRIREIEELKLKAGGESELDLQAQIADLKAGLAAKPENAEANELRVQIEGLKEEIKKTTDATVDLTVKRDREKGEVERIRGLVQAKADDLAESTRSAHIWLHKGASDLTPLVVEVNGDKAILRDLTDPSKVEEWTAAEMLAKLSELAGRSDKSKSYFVFFVRPGGILAFANLVSAAQGAGFGVGYHPIDETTAIRVAPE